MKKFTISKFCFIFALTLSHAYANTTIEKTSPEIYVKENGNTKSAILNNHGIYYATIKSSSKNTAEKPSSTSIAESYFKKAVELKDPIAQNNLGVFYLKVKKDNQKAFSSFKLSAEFGVSQAQLNLGMMYRGGLGVEKNLNQAMHWFLESAKQGNVMAQSILGAAYMIGIGGLQKNYDEAAKWTLKAARQGDLGAQGALCSLINTGVLDHNLDALNLCKVAAKAGDTQAQTFLGIALHEGKHLKPNNDEALYWLQQSIRNGNAFAEFSLGKFYYDLKNGKQAVNWLQKSAKQGNEVAMLYLSMIYYEGCGEVKPNPLQQTKWFIKAHTI